MVSACASTDDGANDDDGGESVGSASAEETSSGPDVPGESTGATMAQESSGGDAPDDTSGAESSTGPGSDDDGSSSGEAPSDTSSTDTGIEPSPECMQYCDEFMPNCSEIAGVEHYDDVDDCLQTCAPWAHGPVGEFEGDTVECRIAHLTFDPTPEPGYYELHCFHAQEHPTSQCV
jgi:hypothetical protein